MKKELPLSEVKTHFPRIVQGVEKREEEIIVTRNGRPAVVILNYDEFQRLRGTVEILTDRALMAQIRKSRKHFKSGKKGLSFEDVFDEPLKPSR
ncbi:MAG TPA: toxin-antitoxin system subunit antitoxin, partial [Deltaproteobacteria bacterium]|nr:toxin-antitoxin system subunit antitoxin [Deltaproteobacteria bacterium]